IQPLLVDASSLLIPIDVAGTDVVGTGDTYASGIVEYDLYVAVNSAPFTKFATVPAESPSYLFTASSNHTYFFRSIARDLTGNEELKPLNFADAFTRVADLDKPMTQIESATATSGGLFTVQVNGTDAGGSQLGAIELFVSVDGGAVSSMGSATLSLNGNGTYSGTGVYQAPADGVSRTFAFYSQGLDTSNNLEELSQIADVTTSGTFAEPPSLNATGINVQGGASQRSVITNVDVLFNNTTGVDALLTPGRIVVERFGLTATNVTAGNGIAVPINNLQQDGGRIRIGFGNALADDGFYRIRVDTNGDGDFDDAGESFEFHRLRGDANGDGIIDSLDTAVVDSLFGRMGDALEGDLDGNGVVNRTDKSYTQRNNVGRKLADSLKAMLDD
ncbi:MAG: hypothetical protein R3C05_31880, partial [Pirellulaceae bacterium]